MLTCFSQTGLLPPMIWRERGMWSCQCRDILCSMTANVVAIRNMLGCENSTRPELHGWLGGEDMVV
jgi:hypothetical protein